MPLTRLKGALFSAAAGIGFFFIVQRPHSNAFTAMNPSVPPWLITAALMVVIEYASSRWSPARNVQG